MSTVPIAKASDTYNRIHLTFFRVLSVSQEGRGLNRIVNLTLIALIVTNIVAVMAETVGWVEARWGHQLQRFEEFSVAVFTVEYLLRLWSITADPRYADRIWGRFRYVLSPLALIDLLAVLPFFLTFVPLDLRILRGLRLMRLVRTLKIGRYSESLQTLGRVFVAKRDELLTTLLAGTVLLVIASALMYYAERDKQPEVFSSIPAVMWWAVSTLTTVGYGDMYPQTTLGKMLGAVVAVLGIGLFALPAGILGSGFVEQLHSKKKETIRCPECGAEINR